MVLTESTLQRRIWRRKRRDMYLGKIKTGLPDKPEMSRLLQSRGANLDTASVVCPGLGEVVVVDGPGAVGQATRVEGWCRQVRTRFAEWGRCSISSIIKIFLGISRMLNVPTRARDRFA